MYRNGTETGQKVRRGYNPILLEAQIGNAATRTIRLQAPPDLEIGWVKALPLIQKTIRGKDISV